MYGERYRHIKYHRFDIANKLILQTKTMLPRLAEEFWDLTPAERRQVYVKALGSCVRKWPELISSWKLTYGNYFRLFDNDDDRLTIAEQMLESMAGSTEGFGS